MVNNGGAKMVEQKHGGTEKEHTYMCTYVHVYIRTYVHTYICAYVHTYIRTYVHAILGPKSNYI